MACTCSTRPMSQGITSTSCGCRPVRCAVSSRAALVLPSNAMRQCCLARATAVALAKQHWRIALLGRTKAALDETAHLTGLQPHDVLVIPCDIGRVEQVQAMARAVLEVFKTVDVLVNAAGTNAPKRSLEVLSLQDYHAM